MSIELLLSTSLFIHIATSCTYYAHRHPEPPFKEVARYPLGICTGNHYSPNTINQESQMYSCSADNTHIIKYTYTDSSKCDGEYTASIATRNPTDFSCDGQQTCPYIVIKVNNKQIDQHDWRKWYSTTWVTNTCQNGELYSCDDNTKYYLTKFAKSSCDEMPQEVWTYSGSQNADSDGSLSYDIYCNEPDPMTMVLNYPDNTMFMDADTVGWTGDGSLTKAVETAICLNGRAAKQHKEIADELVSYCFVGYDEETSKPIYRGDYGEIRWTETAGKDYGGAFGIFLYSPTDTLGLKYPIAYCFSGDSKDITVCNKRWFVNHGTSARYLMDDDMETGECECTVDLSADFHFSPPNIPDAPTTTEETTTAKPVATTTKQAMNGGSAKNAGTTEHGGGCWYDVRMAMYIGVIGCIFSIGL